MVVQGLDATEIEVQLSWQRGMLVFDGEPLDSVLLEIGRYTTVVFAPDDSIRNVRVGGYFRAGDIDGLLVALRESFDIDSREHRRRSNRPVPRYRSAITHASPGVLPDGIEDSLA